MHKKKTFRGELIKLTMAASVCGMLILGMTLITISAVSFSGRASGDMEYYLENINGRFEAKLQYLEDIIISLRHNSVISGFFTENGYRSDAVGNELSYTSDLFSEKNMVDEKNPFLLRVYLFNHKGQFQSNYFYPYTNARLEELDQEYIGLWKSFTEQNLEYRYETDGDVINLCCRLYDADMRETGTCILALDSAALLMLYQDMEKYPDCFWMVTGRNGSILAANENGEKNPSFLSDLSAGNGMAQTGSGRYMYHAVSAGFGMRSVAAVSTGMIYSSVKSGVILFLIVFFLLLAVIAIVVFFVTCRFTKPLLTVAENIKTFGKGDLDTRLESFDLQEFDDISVVFNEMTERIHHLITQVYEKQLLATQAQVHFLQAQINPHFMFNILSMISMRAKIDGNDDVYSMLSAFSRLIQGKIFRREDMKIPLAEEMELVEFYLYLQKQRYRDRLTYEIRIEDEALKQACIPRLCVEPLVENAVSHGLEPKEGAGTIVVEAKKTDGCLLITVTDDGVGFDSDSVTVPKKEPPEGETPHAHVSLANTKKLLQILYGEEYGISIKSRIGAGTRVTVRLPLEEELECGK